MAREWNGDLGYMYRPAKCGIGEFTPLEPADWHRSCGPATTWTGLFDSTASSIVTRGQWGGYSQTCRLKVCHVTMKQLQCSH